VYLFRALFASLALALAVAAPVRAADVAPTSKLDEILARGVLRVGTTGDYKPFSLRVAGGASFVGLDIALASDLSRQLGVRLEIVGTTWATLMPDLAADRFDLAMGVLPSRR